MCTGEAETILLLHLLSDDTVYPDEENLPANFTLQLPSPILNTSVNETLCVSVRQLLFHADYANLDLGINQPSLVAIKLADFLGAKKQLKIKRTAEIFTLSPHVKGYGISLPQVSYNGQLLAAAITKKFKSHKNSTPVRVRFNKRTGQLGFTGKDVVLLLRYKLYNQLDLVDLNNNWVNYRGQKYRYLSFKKEVIKMDSPHAPKGTVISWAPMEMTRTRFNIPDLNPRYIKLTMDQVQSYHSSGPVIQNQSFPCILLRSLRKIAPATFSLGPLGTSQWYPLVASVTNLRTISIKLTDDRNNILALNQDIAARQSTVVKLAFKRIPKMLPDLPILISSNDSRVHYGQNNSQSFTSILTRPILPPANTRPALALKAITFSRNFYQFKMQPSDMYFDIYQPVKVAYQNRQTRLATTFYKLGYLVTRRYFKSEELLQVTNAASLCGAISEILAKKPEDFRREDKQGYNWYHVFYRRRRFTEMVNRMYQEDIGIRRSEVSQPATSSDDESDDGVFEPGGSEEESRSPSKKPGTGAGGSKDAVEGLKSLMTPSQAIKERLGLFYYPYHDFTLRPNQEDETVRYTSELDLRISIPAALTYILGLPPGDETTGRGLLRENNLVGLRSSINLNRLLPRIMFLKCNELIGGGLSNPSHDRILQSVPISFFDNEEDEEEGSDDEDGAYDDDLIIGNKSNSYTTVTFPTAEYQLLKVDHSIPKLSFQLVDRFGDPLPFRHPESEEVILELAVKYFN